MRDRKDLAGVFLQQAGWAQAQRRALAGDASGRRYQRLRMPGGGESAVLMDAPPDKGEDVRPFVGMAAHLRALGLSPPLVLAQDLKNGFLLLEDLGDDLFATVLLDEPSLELPLYQAAVDLLVHLHGAPVPSGLETYTPRLMARYVAPALDYYPPVTTPPTDAAKQVLFAELETVLARFTLGPVLVLRDFHAENLLWLPDRPGNARVGLLDFQDAVAGHPAYDLVSLLEDARRDVTDQTRTAMIAHYAHSAGLDVGLVSASFCAQGAQRNLRILGVFARLCLQGGKPSYVELLPRVWDHLMRDLSHPALSALKSIILRTFSAPTPDVLTGLNARCPTPQPH